MLFGMFFILASEWNSPAFAGMNGGQKLLNSMFQAVMASSTAGFSSIDQTAMSSSGKILTCILMFIGSSPGSTGGGIKTTTFALLVLMGAAGLRGKDDVIVAKRTIEMKTCLRAVAVTVLATAVIFTGFLLIGATDGDIPTGYVFFETMTAFTTTGLSMSLPPILSPYALYTLAVVMFIGRLGPLSVGMIFARQDRSSLKFPTANIMIG